MDGKWDQQYLDQKLENLHLSETNVDMVDNNMESFSGETNQGSGQPDQPLSNNHRSIQQDQTGQGSNQGNQPIITQLLQVLKSPESPQQKQQVLELLKANPHLMAALIKARQKVLMSNSSSSFGNNKR